MQQMLPPLCSSPLSILLFASSDTHTLIFLAHPGCPPLKHLVHMRDKRIFLPRLSSFPAVELKILRFYLATCPPCVAVLGPLSSFVFFENSSPLFKYKDSICKRVLRPLLPTFEHSTRKPVGKTFTTLSSDESSHGPPFGTRAILLTLCPAFCVFFQCSPNTQAW